MNQSSRVSNPNPMITTTILLLPSVLLMISLHFFTISNADCIPSACGLIPNISNPFRLKNDHKHCGHPEFELACENNVTSLYVNSHRYYVKEINYHNSTIRLVDASLNNHDICSFPNSSAYAYNFTYRYDYTHKHLHPYQIHTYPDDHDVLLRPINFLSCPLPLNNSSFLALTDITANCASTSNVASQYPTRYTYVKVGSMHPSNLTHMCTLDVIVMTSWSGFKDVNNVSISEFQSSLLYGFELYFCSDCISTWWDKNERWIMSVAFLLIAVVVSAAVGPPLMMVIVFTGVLGLLSLLYYQYFGLYLNLPTYLIQFVVTFAPRIIIFALALWFLTYTFRRRNMSIFGAIECYLKGNMSELMPIRYSYSEIKKMTRGFQEKLGEGGYGCVYKGKLRSGNSVAIKLLGKSAANGQDFMNEISTTGRIHHVNVVKLVGYCAERSKRALVFDLMPNGSLDKYLFNHEKMSFLNWDNKFEIAVGVARGIEYLHKGCDIQILHFDIKPHNVLLDHNLVPKISDFGLAKYFSTEKDSVTLTAARGTIGYVAPELINRGIGAVSYKADVYSFGMLLMEIVGLNRDRVGHHGSSSKYFPYWIYDHFNQGKDIEIGDADEEKYCDDMRKVVRKMTIVALWCIQMSPDDRPSMSKVLEMLEADVERLQIPEYPSQSSQITVDTDQTGTATVSTDSVSMQHNDEASLSPSPSVEITVQG